MTKPFVVACIQTNAGSSLAPNLAAASALVLKAREKGADFILLPENVAMMDAGRKGLIAHAKPEETHPALAHFCSLAKETNAWLLVGSLAVQLDEGDVANRSFLLDGTGQIVARYDKIHMFDADLENGESYKESDSYRSGDRAVLAKTSWGDVGLTICYDLRFPHLYRALAKAGASYFAVPSAFTRVTGKAHWHALLRSRAIENGAYVFAPAQCGSHGRRQTFGHSLIVDPWGEVLGDGGDHPGIVLAKIDPSKVAAARRKIPSLQHDRSFVLSSKAKPSG
ncbi:carbon-nitrogen hydrolase family protein [Rhodospirillaceae bacterium AH-315-P19]|nr:carbon-nitrogen hydrolase family protein [Rhodospirillaceae bacterium AH-315-P19]